MSKFSSRQAVITGFGCISGLGVGWAAFTRGLKTGACAIGPIKNFDARNFPCKVGGEVPINLDQVHTSHFWQTHAPCWSQTSLPALVSSGGLLDRKLVFGILAALEAADAARLSSSTLDTAVLALGIGVENAFFADIVHYLHTNDQGRPSLAWDRDATVALPAYRVRSPIEKTGNAVALALGIHGPVFLHASACASGAVAVAHAAALIEQGAANVVIAGATDSMLNPGGLGGMALIGATSPRAASDACRPFDQHRDGIAIGEGAAIFVVEELTSAQGRGATIWAHIDGWGSSQDAYRPSAPEPSGVYAAQAIRDAITRAGIAPGDIQYINAHGTGTALNDLAETQAIRSVFGAASDAIAVSSIKGATGHLMAASGAIELAAVVMALHDGFLPGTCNLVTRDEECNLNVLGPQGLYHRITYALSNSFGIGGQNASIVMRAAATKPHV
jgi:3-oxoacyl-[acyl-carrier-protein] synthase II